MAKIRFLKKGEVSSKRPGSVKPTSFYYKRYFKIIILVQIMQLALLGYVFFPDLIGLYTLILSLF